MLGNRYPNRAQPRRATGPARDKLTRGLIFLSDAIAGPSDTVLNVAKRTPNAINEYTDSTYQLTEHANTRLGSLVGVGSLYPNTRMLLPTSSINSAIASSGEVTSVVILRSIYQDPSGGSCCLLLGGSGVTEHYPYTDGKIYQGPFSTTRWISAVTPAIDLTTPHMYAISHKSGSQVAYLNAEVMASASISETPACADASFAKGRAGGAGATGYVYMVALWNRVLAQSELRDIYVNPWRLYSGPKISFPISSVATSLPTLSASTYVAGSLTSTGWRPQITAS